MNSQKIVCIVPRLPPAIDGVGDYALNLAKQLRKDYEIQTHFIVGDPNWKGQENIEGFSVSQVTSLSANEIMTLLNSHARNSDPLLLHYVGYGYARRGCPIWLIQGLQAWQKKNPQEVLLTMFHEIYAFGSPWTSSFWLSPLQRELATRLARISDHCITSKQLYAKILQKIRKQQHKPITSLPVFSNVGEPLVVPPLKKRKRYLVVFGGKSNRIRVYKESAAELRYAYERLKIEKILDIGPKIDLASCNVNKLPIVAMGEQRVTEISAILQSSLAGFFNYPVEFLAKSTIFAAYCAHGLLPVSAKDSIFSIDEIESGKHFWFASPQATQAKNEEQIQAIADEAYAWYHTHSLSVQAKVFKTHLNCQD